MREKKKRTQTSTHRSTRVSLNTRSVRYSCPLVCFVFVFIPAQGHKKPLCLHGTNNDRSTNKPRPCVTLFKYIMYIKLIYNVVPWSPNLLKSHVVLCFASSFICTSFFTRIGLTRARVFFFFLILFS